MKTSPMPSRPALSRWVEQLQSQGRYTFTRGEAEASTSGAVLRDGVVVAAAIASDSSYL